MNGLDRICRPRARARTRASLFFLERLDVDVGLRLNPDLAARLDRDLAESAVAVGDVEGIVRRHDDVASAGGLRCLRHGGLLDDRLGSLDARHHARAIIVPRTGSVRRLNEAGRTSLPAGIAMWAYASAATPPFLP